MCCVYACGCGLHIWLHRHHVAQLLFFFFFSSLPKLDKNGVKFLSLPHWRAFTYVSVDVGKSQRERKSFPSRNASFWKSLLPLRYTMESHTEGTISNFRLQVKKQKTNKKKKHAHWACTRKGLLLRPHLITFQWTTSYYTSLKWLRNAILYVFDLFDSPW